MAQQQTDELFFVSHNPSAAKTVVLLHDLFSCNLEWEHVAPHLADYHLLIPDLPHHSQSRHIRPYSSRLAADGVAALIERHARGGTAHVVGLSLGGVVAMELVRSHAALVDSALVSGAAPSTGWTAWAAQSPTLVHWGFWFLMSSGLYKAAEVQTGLRRHEELKREIAANNTWDLNSEASADAGKWQQGALSEVGLRDKRILAVAGGHGDDVDATRKMAEALALAGEKSGKETRAVVVKEAIHGWNLQFPELFAAGIKAWVEGEPLPEEFETLS